MMNTPEKSQIGGSLSKFEDSPVFNYLSNLSPIKPVKSAPITQSFNSLNFSSLPSIFTSPHASLQKDSRFLKRHNMDASSNKENEVFVDANQLRDCSSDSGEVPPEPLNAESEPQIEPYRDDTRCNCDILDRDLKAGFSAKGNALYPADGCTSISGTDIHESPSGWESLVSDGADLLMFDSPNIAKDLKTLFKSPPMVRVGSSVASHFQQDNPGFLESDSSFLVDVGEFQTEVHSAETEAVDCTHYDYPSMIECLTNHPNENADDEQMASLHRGLRRRCLVFDANAAHRKNILGASGSNSSIHMQPDQNLASTIRKPVTSMTASRSSLRVLSGIGLHLNNTLAPSGVNGVHVSVTSSTSTASFQSPKIAQEPLPDVFPGASLEMNSDCGPSQGSDDAVLAIVQVSVDDFDQNSPRKKRPKSESSSDESCKRCNCKKSKCLKLYCECFAAGVYCIGTCACQDCYNKPIHEETVLSTRKQIESRNPLAFAPKVITLPDVKDEVMNTPASARHKRGCNCKKSSCQKKYCECYQGGVGCSVNCRCETCKNIFGTKDGSVPVTLNGDDDDEDEEEETEKVDKKMNKKGSRNIKKLLHQEEHNRNTFHATPLRLTRMSMPQPFSSKDKPPRSSFLAVRSATGQNTNQTFHKPKFQSNYSAMEDGTELPEMLQSNDSPVNIVKTSSPNSKRIITSPRTDFGSLSDRRSTRKLILQSIPSFPSLTQP